VKYPGGWGGSQGYPTFISTLGVKRERAGQGEKREGAGDETWKMKKNRGEAKEKKGGINDLFPIDFDA